MKKILSCMLAVAMMLSLLCAVPTQAAPYSGYPFVFEDFENGKGLATGPVTWVDGEGAGSSDGSLLVKLTGKENQDFSITCTEAPQKNAKLKFSAWVKMENSEVASGKDWVSFIVYGRVRFPLTDASLAGENAPDHVIKNGWIQVYANNTGLRKGEWVYVTTTHDWDGQLTAFPTAGYGGVKDNSVARSDDILDFTGLNLRVAGGGLVGLADTTQTSLNYYIDDVCYEAVPNDMAVSDTNGANIVKGGEMDNDSSISQLGLSRDNATFVASTEEDPAPDGSAGFIKLRPKDNKVYWPQISQTMSWQPNHLYHVSFYMRLDSERDEGKETTTIISDNAGVNTLEMTEAGAWLLQLAGGRIRDINGMNLEYPGKVNYSIANFDNGWQKVEYYFVNNIKTVANQSFTAWLRLFPNKNKDVMNNASYSIDAFNITDMGSVSNGDFELEANDVPTFRNNSTYNVEPIPGWNTINADMELSDDVAPDSEGNKSLKVKVTADGGAAMQGIEMKQDQTYKLTFKAKGLSNTSPIPLALQLDRYVTSVYEYDVWDTPNYEYYYGTNKKTTSYSPHKQSDQEWYLTNEWQTYTCYIHNTFGLLEGKTIEDAKAYHQKSATDTTMVYEGITMPRLPIMYWNVNGNAPGTEYLIDDVKIEGVNTFPVISNLKVNGEVAPGKEISVSYDYESALDLADTNSIARVYGVDEQGRRASLGTFRTNESFILPKTTLGKDIDIEVLPIDESMTCGYPVSVRAQNADDPGANFYQERSMSINASKTEATWKLDVTTAQGVTEGYMVVMAAYTADKELAFSDVTYCSIEEGANVYTGSFSIPSNATKVKMFVWDEETLAPVFDVLEEKLPVAAEDPFEGDDEVNIVFVGDSIYANAGANGEQNGFVYQVGEWMKQAYAKEGRTINWYNTSYGGTTTDYTFVRFQRDVLSKNPDMIFFSMTCNDGTGTDTLRNVESCMRMVNELENKPYMVLTLLTNRGFGNSTEKTEKVANFYGLPYFDNFEAQRAAVAAGTAVEDLYISDGVHPNPAGYKVIADALIEWVGGNRNFARPVDRDDKLVANSGIVDNMEVFAAKDTSRVTRNGSWTEGSNYLATTAVGSTLEFDFSGDILCFETGLHKYAGKVEVYVDGNLIWTDDPYYNMDGFQMTVRNGNFNFDLPDGDHHVVLKVVGGQNTATQMETRIYNIFAGSWR